jgi:hypothetical protein
VPLFDDLIDDARLLAADPSMFGVAIRQYVESRDGASGEVVGRLMVPDTRLVAALRAAPVDVPVPVSVVNSGGAGGIVSLANRVGTTSSGLHIVAVESAIRDLDDPAANAQRIVSAVDALEADLDVFIELPYAAGWARAVEVVEAAGHFGKLEASQLDRDDRVDSLAEQLSVLIEADLPFKISLPAEPMGSAYTLLRVLDGVAALIDGADVRDAAALLRRPDGDLQPRTAEHLWDTAAQQRLRRRVSRVSGPVVAPSLSPSQA